MDACSGYEASELSFFEWPNGTLTNTEQFQGFDCKFYANFQESYINVIAGKICDHAWYTIYDVDNLIGYNVLGNATTVTSIYTTVAVCATYYLPSSNLSAPPINFTYTVPNTTDVEGTGSESGYFSISSYCYTLNEDQPTTKGNMEFGYEEMALYYWQNIDLNTTWWNHFHEDPLLSDYGDWASWDFYPTDPNNFRCVSDSGVYQASFLPSARPNFH
jgi:hypothetical protein